MRIALLGTRGIPANYGGFETFYENFGPRLAARGHQVWGGGPIRSGMMRRARRRLSAAATVI